MKKTMIALLSMSISVALAAPSVSYNTSNISSGADTEVSVDFKNDAFGASGVEVRYTLNLPANVTVSAAATSPFTCDYDGSANTILITAFDVGGNAIADTSGVCKLTFSVPSSVTSGAVTSAITTETYSKVDAGGNVVEENGSSSLSELSIVSGGSGFKVTATAGANGALACTPTSGAAGTAVACTATPNANFEVDTWSGACASTTAGATTCNFTLNKDETVGVSFKAAGGNSGSFVVTTSPVGNGAIACNPMSGNSLAEVTCNATPGGTAKHSSWGGSCSGTPVGQNCTFTPVAGENIVSAVFTSDAVNSNSRPVPAIGLLGLFGMLASLMGAAAMVLRRKV